MPAILVWGKGFEIRMTTLRKRSCYEEVLVKKAGLRRSAGQGYDFFNSRPGNGEPVTGAGLRAAIDEVLAGRDTAGPAQHGLQHRAAESA